MIDFKTKIFDYYHNNNIMDYNYKNNRSINRWIISRGHIIGQIGEERHVHVNDYTNNIKYINQMSNRTINPLRTDGLNPSEIDIEDPIFKRNNPIIALNITNNEQVELNQLNGMVDFICYVKDIKSGYRRGIYDYRYMIFNSNGSEVYDSGYIVIGDIKIQNPDYFNLYSTIANTEINHNDSYYGIRLSARMNSNCEDCELSISNVYFDSNILNAEDEYTLKIYVRDIYNFGANTNFITEQISRN